MANAAEKLEACFSRLQNLAIMPTLKNMEILVQTLYDLREVHNELKKGEENERQAARPE